MNFQIYPGRSRPLSQSTFRDPPAAFRGVPFWSWNNRLDVPQLLRQLGYFKQMGMGGVHIHSRTGLDTPYLSDEFMRAVRACHDEAARLGMATWLYDEDRWPSGFAGGLVTRNPEHRCKHLLFTAIPYEKAGGARAESTSIARGTRTGKGTLLAIYVVELSERGELERYARVAPGGEVAPSPRGTVWYAYAETAEPTAWFNHQTYVDALSRAAIERFVETTYDRYHAVLGDEFGQTVPAIFTDEPQVVRKVLLPDGSSKADCILPFTTDLPETFAAAHGCDLLDALPEIFWPLPGGRVSRVRYCFHDHVAERFASAFADTLGRWCGRHHIALTGHMLGEGTLDMQTHWVGESMRSYRAFDIPGIDVLCDELELTTAKQAQSAARQYGRPAVLSELYGVTGWPFTFAGHKRQGDWQAALGVTVRVHHLAWVSMKGEAKRDYPASISYQSPWYDQYKQVEDHFARLNAVLTRGEPIVRVAVVHPIESYWLAFGAGEAARLERERLETGFQDLTAWLVHGTVDFDFVCESLLPSQTPVQTGGRFGVGVMAYDVVIVPQLKTIRSTTLDRLEAFAAAGGDVVFAGRVPTHVDAVESERPARLAVACRRIDMNRPDVLAAVEPYRVLRVSGDEGRPTFVHQARQDGVTRYLFVCSIDRDEGRRRAQVEMPGDWIPTLLDTLTGRRLDLRPEYVGGRTRVPWDCPPHGSILLELAPGRRDGGAPPSPPPALVEVARLDGPVPVTLSEPNVLLLDQAEWRMNDGPWQPVEEVLRVLNLARGAVGLPPRQGHVEQPWADAAPAPVLGQLQLRFAVRCEVAVAGPKLALEDSKQTGIAVDGRSVDGRPDGHFVDEAIETVPLPDLPAGSHEIVLTVPLTRKREVEWCYLLGDFGVRVAGRRAVIVAPVRELDFGDFTRQGLPFYAGNVAYHCTLPPIEGAIVVEAADFAGPTLRAALDGADAGSLAFAPHRVALPSRGPGRFDLTLFGNRANAFGPVHNTRRRIHWYGPDSWRTTGPLWSYEYRLQPMGVLSAPRVLQTEEPLASSTR